jgi:inorganic triphosphatase YgiF
VEIEAKFRVPDRRVFAALLSLPAIAGSVLAARPAPEQQHTIYFDTPDSRLRAWRASLRLREVEGSRTATVKRSHGGSGAVHVRDEWEVAVGVATHPRFWPSSEARAQALALVGGAPLLPQVRVVTRRHVINAYRAERLLAELCLDEGHVGAGGRVLGFRELEVELVDGTLAELDELCVALAGRFALHPEPLGKRSRGFALLDAATPREPCHAIALGLMPA